MQELFSFQNDEGSFRVRNIENDDTSAVDLSMRKKIKRSIKSHICN